MASASPQPDQTARPSPYHLIGERAGVARLVAAFYDLVETDPAYAELREMHQPDLAPVRAALEGFLVGWLGGPRDWFEANPGKCMMSVHGQFAIGEEAARQWVAAMSRALAGSGVEPGIAVALNTAFARMASGMINRG